MIEPAPSNVTPIWPHAAPLTHTPPPPAAEQSNGPYNALIHRLETYRFRGARDFTRRHHRYADAIADVLDYLDDLPETEYDRITNPAALIRADIHKSIATPRGDSVVCPACRWSGDNISREETNAGTP